MRAFPVPADLLVAVGTIGGVLLPGHDERTQPVHHAGQAGIRRRQQGGGGGQEERRRQHRSQDGVMADGTKAADGNYTFSVEAVQGGNKVTATALQIGTVSALVRSSNGFLLDLGTLGTVDFSDVQQIL